ncbi:MAG: hypothetical protein HF978_10055 [Desulfobacteraceae bacterium]|nr:hypothetical protein [Desulfobacteraceae bacterium]MBC2755879.1 hypothetical protein [Desulfobacteraceae bacterium]MBC2763954.1 hypothetical protein [ANME-2 cluster archaeon]
MRENVASISILVIIFVLGLTNLWAGDSEIRLLPGETARQELPLVVEPETEPVEEATTETLPLAEPAEVVAEAEPQPEPEEVVAKVKPPVVIPPPPEPKDNLEQAAELMDMKGLKNYKQALDLCMTAAENDPNSFRANWMAAKACRLYGMEAQELELSDWEDTCKSYGKKGMGYGEKAIALDSKKSDGHYWYGMNVGIYSDSVSILTALREGLKDKTQDSFEAAYKIDKYYDKGGPIAALGRFWQVLPWPLSDKDKSMEYYREFQNTKFFGIEYNVKGNVFFAELLMDKKKTKNEAKAMLEQVPKISSNKYWNKKAKELLAEM